MPNTNPTIVSASLSDKELQDSINKMVANFDKGLQTMLEHSNEYVGKIQASLQKIGDTNFGAKGSNDGAVVKQTKAQNDFTDAVKKSTNEIKRQGKEGEMSFDQIAAALDKARRTVSEFNTNRASGILPSSEDYKRYEQALARIVEYNDKLKQSALGKAFANEQSFAFDANRNINDMFAVDERLKQLNKYYAEQEKMTAKRQALVDKEVAAYNDAMRKKEQSLASYTEKERASIEKYQDKVLKTAWRDALRMPTENIDQVTAKIERIKSLISTLHPIGIISKADVDVANATISKLEKRFDIQSAVNSELKKESAFANQSRQSIEALNAAVAQNTRKEDERRIAIIRSGQAAQESLAKIKQNAQIELADNTGKPISGLKELTAAIREMERAYWDMSSYGKESPIGQSLKADIEYARKLRTAIEAYNRTIGGFSVIGNKDSANNTLGSYSELSMLLKTLADDYKKLGREERNAAKGNDLADKIQRLGRETQKIQQQMNRPINLEAALKGSEKTIDDITYKIRRLQSYKVGIDLTKPNAASEIKQVDEAILRLQKDMDKYLGKSKDIIASNNALGRSWNYMKNRLAFYFTVGASTQFIKNLIEVRSQYEMNERALGILINSAERGTQIFNELSQMALVSPYTLIELSSAAKQLTAYDVAAKDVVDTTRRLADMAAAVGIPIERLTYALGQIKAYGYLNSRDARMFANAGIPLVKQLSDYYTELEGKMVSTADVYDRMKKKAIDYNSVMAVVTKMTDEGGKFFDFQAKMADTLKVRLANLTLAWNNMLNDMGKESQGVLTWGIGALRDLFLQWKQLDKLIKDAALAVGVRTLLVALRAATIGLGSFGKAMTWNAILGKKLGGIVVGLAKSFGTLFSSRLTWFALLAMAAVEATQALFGVNEAQKALNESIRNGAKDNYDNISKFLEQYKEIRESLYATQKVAIGNIYNPVTRKAEASSYAEQQVGQDIDQNEAKKAWEAIREQIELTVASSDKYIGNLLSISNMSERVRQGFNLLDDVQVVNAALKELDDDTIKVSKDLSAWWNAWQAPDGLIGNLKDLVDAENELVETYGSVEAAKQRGGQLYTDYEKRELANFRDDLQETTDSIINFIELKGWSGDEGKINQVFEQITQKLVLDNQLDPQKAFTLQTEVEEARSKAAKEALLQRINDERAALKISHDDSVREALAADEKRYKNWEETNGRSKVEWERFTKWLKEQHISETTAMFRNMDEEDIKSINFQEGNHAEWVTRMVTQYAKEHKMSYDEAFKYLKSWVRSANQWSIFIPLTISTENKKSVYDQLGEYDKAIDEADAQIERLTKRIGELNAKKQKSKEETQELANAEQELADAQKAKADAEAKGGHGKKEKKDERAANKAAKQAESELQKALKDELSTIDKVRSIYKDLTKDGMSHANAVERATRGWDETVDAINRVLRKNGLQKLDLSKFAGIENPRELVNILQSQLNTLLKRGAKPAEIKELQTKVNTLEVDADKYDLTKITKGLNNELGKLKDEYELAVELDANPEMGNMFAEMFGINTSAFPRTINEFMQMAQQEFEDVRKKLNLSESINIFTANSEKWYKWGKAVGYSKEQVDDFKKSFDGSVAVAKKWAQDVAKQTQDLQYKLADNNGKIAIEEEKLANLRVRLANEVNDEQKRLLELQIQDQQNAIAKLKEELLQMLPTYQRVFGEVAEHSAWMTRKLARDYKNMLVEGKNRGLNPDNTYSVRDPITGQIARITKERMGKEIKNADKELQKTQSTVKKITEAFKKGEDGVADWVHGVELVSGELQKIGSLVSVIGEISSAFGNPNEYDETAEVLGDIGTTMEGLATAGQGVAKIYSGDIIGGATDVVKGLWTSVSTWFDNTDKRIQQEIKDSERAVKRLENAYIDLEHAVNEAYGMATIGANMAAKANKELQLVELKRQLALERSRDSKNRDEDKIIDLQKQIKELEYDIADTVDSIVNDLLGISSVGDAMENMMDAFIEALRSGEDAMATFDKNVDEMIANMVKKMYVTKILQPWFEEQWNKIQEQINQRAGDIPEKIAKIQSKTSIAKSADTTDNNSLVEALRALGMSDDQIHRLNWYNEFGKYDFGFGRNTRLKAAYEKMLKEAEQKEAELQKELTTATMPTTDDIRQYAELLRSGQPIMEENMQEVANFLRELGLMKDDANKNLSALQQGISQISEETAGAIEAYLNGVSQQVYLHSDLLTQIRDAVVSFDMDVQLGVFSQMLLQLQNNYIVMQSMQSMMENWTVPSGSGIRVELMS